VVLNDIGFGPSDKVLDLGCGCGGLGLALKEKFGLKDYVGVEINEAATKTARQMNPDAHFINGDILTIESDFLEENTFVAVISLSCIDWNVGFDYTLPRAYQFVKDGGWFIASFRLTEKEKCDDLSISYQYINYDGQKKGEIAAYVVLNAKELLHTLEDLSPMAIKGYGYWGKPGQSAVTPYDRVCFAVLAIRKKIDSDTRVPEIEFKLPSELMPRLGI
jgi:SAM-dependent methyltransferase